MEEDLPTLWVEGARSLEGQYMIFTVRLSEPATDEVRVSYQALSGTALREFDVYQWSGDPLAGELVFAPDEEVKTLSFLVDAESEDEIDENVLLSIFDPVGATFTGGAQALTAVGWALDDDGGSGNRAIAVSAPVIVEGPGRNAVFTVSLSEAFDTARSFSFTTFDGTAESGSDYVARSGTVTFAAGQTEAIVEIDLFNDRAVEEAETFGLRIEAAADVSATVGTAQILNDDGSRPVLSVDGTRHVEGEYLTFTVRLSEPATDAVTVNYQALSGTGLREFDVYQWSGDPLAGELVFAPDEEIKTLSFLVDAESEDEIDENVLLSIFDPVGATFAGGAQGLTAVGWALDDDGVGLNRAIAASAPVIVEGPSRNAVFTVSLSEAFDTARSFSFSTFDGTAAAGSDYEARSGTITFAAGQTEAFVEIDLLNDRAVEAAETFGLRIDAAHNVRATAGEAQILNDDGSRPVLSVDGTRHVEGEYLTFTVRLSEPTTDAVTVNYRTLAGTGTPLVDVYQWSGDPLAGELVFAPGEEVKTLSFLVDAESEDEIDENVLLEIYQPSGAVLAGGAQTQTAIGWALDDDGVGVNRSVAVSSPVVYEGNQAVFIVELSQASTTSITLGYETASGTASSRRDFSAAEGQITFAAGQTRAYVTVDLLTDLVRENAETLNLTITSYPSQISSLRGEASGLGTIVDGTIRGSSRDNTLEGTEGSDRIEGLSGDDLLRGFGGRDYLIGGAGDDTFNGGGGADRMAGGAGDDFYLVSDAGDTTEESANRGTDMVRSSRTWTLDANVENLTLTGSGDLGGSGNGLANVITGNRGDNALSGGAGHDRLAGGAGDDRLSGGAGDDRIDGGAGADRLLGGRGRDTYVVDSRSDSLAESSNGGTDMVRSSVSWTLGINFENLVLTGSANLSGTGNGGANSISGNGGDNRLFGSYGADTLSGRAGDDRITGGTGLDRMSGGAGDDRFIFLSASESSVRSRRDVITDFTSREDAIDLSAVDANSARGGNQNFDFIGRAAFSETRGELRFASGILQADLDGDGGSDFQIELTDLARLASSDLLL